MTTRRIGVCGIILLFTACSGQVEPGDEAPSALEIPEDWIGNELGVTPPRVVVEGPARFVSPDEARLDPPLHGESKPVASTESSPDPSWRIVRMDTGLVYRVTFDEAPLQQLADALVARGDTAGFRPAGDTTQAEEGPAPEAASSPDLPDGYQATWSDGADTRIRRGIADGYPVNHWPYRAIGHFTGGEGCTGTLIGRRTVLTAAHCVARQGIGVVTGNSFRARSDNTQGAASQLEPYGTAKVVTVWVPWQYIDEDLCEDTGAASQIACNKYDIAVAELDDNVGDLTGAFGYGWAPGGTLEQYYMYMRGYPSCNLGWADRPDTCPDSSVPKPTRNAALWGDVQNCSIGDFWSPDSEGWSREFSVHCDGSRGMSGSAVYSLQSPINPGNPIAFGVYSQTLCTAGGCAGDSYPNDITRITPTYGNIIVAIKSLWGG